MTILTIEKTERMFYNDLNETYVCFIGGSAMDYTKEIISLLKKLDANKLRCVYQFIKGLLD